LAVDRPAPITDARGCEVSPVPGETMTTIHAPVSTRASSPICLGLLLALCACSSNQPATKSVAPGALKHAELTNEVTADASVVAVDAEARVVTLRRDDGRTMRVRCGPDVRNFAQIAVGDTLRVQYRETLAASVRPAGEPAAPVEAAAASLRAAPGNKPAGAVGVGVGMRVKVESIDLQRGIVVFSKASGEVVAHRIRTPEGRAFVEGVKIGDTVQIEYTESVALSVEKQ
jgi:hypothetical protein